MNFEEYLSNLFFWRSSFKVTLLYFILDNYFLHFFQKSSFFAQNRFFTERNDAKAVLEIF